MTSFKILGAALIVAAIAVPASAQVSEPAAAASQDPSFSIYSNNGYPSGGYALEYPRPLAAPPFNPNTMAQTWVPVRPHRAHHAPIKHY